MRLLPLGMLAQIGLTANDDLAEVAAQALSSNTGLKAIVSIISIVTVHQSLQHVNWHRVRRPHVEAAALHVFRMRGDNCGTSSSGGGCRSKVWSFETAAEAFSPSGGPPILHIGMCTFETDAAPHLNLVDVWCEFRNAVSLHLNAIGCSHETDRGELPLPIAESEARLSQGVSAESATRAPPSFAQSDLYVLCCVRCPAVLAHP